MACDDLTSQQGTQSRFYRYPPFCAGRHVGDNSERIDHRRLVSFFLLTMPTDCCIKLCHNSSTKDKELGVKRSYFRIPAVKESQGPLVRELTETRRREWIRQIYRKDITFNTTKAHFKVCSDHFLKGKPAYEMMKNDPDWIPTLRLGHNFAKSSSVRGPRLQARCEQQQQQSLAANHGNCDAVDTCRSNQSDSEMEIDCENDDTEHDSEKKIKFVISGILEGMRVQDVSTQTELSSDRIAGMEEELNRLLVENIKLKREFENSKFDEKFFQGNDEKVKFFTGLPNVTTLMLLFDFLRPHLPCGPRSSLSRFEMMLLCFMRLRFNLPLQLLAYMFNLSRTTASACFHTTIHVMSVHLHPLIIWPERDVLRATQPTEFRKAFGGRIAVTIDCFEIFIDTPSDLVARAQTFSSYKHHNTVKYLIGITPAGAISYISRGWGGRTSDKHITQFSNFVNQLVPGDIVLADRGFDISDVLGYVQAEVKIPAFTKGKPQLSAHEIESTRKIAHIRIHIERVIGVVCGKYSILNGSIPVEMLSTRDGERMCTLDKIVTTCCALVNLCESVVPLK